MTPRCLHVVENMDRGAVENWLVRMLRHARTRNVDVDWTFYCALGRPGKLDDEVRALGARVVHSPVRIGDKPAFLRAFRAELKHGGYDVLHAHHDLVSAVYLLAAFGLPVRKRIVHVHNPDEAVLTPSRVKGALFRPMSRAVCLRLAHAIVGISDHTLSTFVRGLATRADCSVHYYGIDPSHFTRARGDRTDFRRALGIDDNAKVLLFAGRMVPEKNPLFAIEVLAELCRLEADVVGVFAGTGSLLAEAERLAAKLGIESKVRFLGWRDDVAEVMVCSDCFILPHPEELREGFGIAVVEAQLAGLPLLLSEGIADDPLLPTARFRRLPLAAGPASWARAASDLLRESRPSRADALAALRQSPMDLDRALDQLLALHA